MWKKMEKYILKLKIKTQNAVSITRHLKLPLFFMNTDMKFFLFMGKIRCKANHILFYLQVYDQCLIGDYRWLKINSLFNIKPVVGSK